MGKEPTRQGDHILRCMVSETAIPCAVWFICGILSKCMFDILISHKFVLLPVGRPSSEGNETSEV